MQQLISRSRVQWACRRGMLELDYIFNEFLEHGFDDLTEQERQDFLIFLENSDPDLYSWLMGFRYPESAADRLMVDLIKKSSDRLSNADPLDN